MSLSISVAMCTYNGAPYLSAQLQSIAAQTRPPDELVVCDDHSTDATVALLDEFAASAPFPVRVHVNAHNLGSTCNFERAIRRCRCDVIVLCDQDDIWHADKLARLAAPFAAPEVGAAFSDAELIDARGCLVGRRLWAAVGFTPAQQRRARCGRLFDVLLIRNVVSGAAMAFRATCREQVLPIPTTWIHDGWIALILAARVDVSLIAAPLMRYRVHARQAIGMGTGSHSSPATTTSCVAVADQFGAVRDHLATLPGVRDRQRALERVTAKSNHLRARAHLPQLRIARVGRVARELLSGRYHRYSLGFRSVARDLVF